MPKAYLLAPSIRVGIETKTKKQIQKRIKELHKQAQEAWKNEHIGMFELYEAMETELIWVLSDEKTK